MITVGSIRKSDGSLILAVQFPTYDLSGYEVVFFENYRARVLPLDISGVTAIGHFSALENVPDGGNRLGDIEKLRRLLPYLLILRERGDDTTAIVKGAREFNRINPEIPRYPGQFKRRFDSFATLLVLGEADIVLSEEAIHSPMVMGFSAALSSLNIAWMQTAIEISCSFDDSEFIDSLRFTSSPVERPASSIKFVHLPWRRINDYMVVMKKANERNPPAFEDPVDFDHAREELQFSLRPDVHRTPGQGPFSRVDAWLAQVDGEPCGVIGLAIFAPPEGSCWVTWYATLRGQIGLGSYLMALAASIAKERGFENLHVWTGQVSEPAIRAYKRMGFIETQTKPPDLPVGLDFAAFERSLADLEESYPMSLQLRG